MKKAFVWILIRGGVSSSVRVPVWSALVHVPAFLNARCWLLYGVSNTLCALWASLVRPWYRLLRVRHPGSYRV